jgi:hypothetical protein
VSRAGRKFFIGVPMGLGRAGNFRLHKPRDPLADVTFHAGHARVRTEVVRGEFRLHHLVAGLAAERHGLGKIKRVVRSDGREQQERHAARDERHQHAPVARPVQVNLQRRRPAAACAAAAFQPRAAKSEGNATDQKLRHDDVGQDADVGIGKFGDCVEDKEQQE